MSPLPRIPHSPHTASWQLLELPSVLTHNSLTSVPSNSLLLLFFIPASHIDRTLSSVQCGTLSSRTVHTHKCHFPSHLHMSSWWLWSLWIPVVRQKSPQNSLARCLSWSSVCQEPKEVCSNANEGMPAEWGRARKEGSVSLPYLLYRLALEGVV